MLMDIPATAASAVWAGDRSKPAIMAPYFAAPRFIKIVEIEVVPCRKRLGSPVVIVPPDGHSGGSGVRCQTYNDSLPGSVPNSRHVQGKAADFIAPGKSDTAVEAILADMKSTGMIRYWYCISPGAHHMDVL